MNQHNREKLLICVGLLAALEYVVEQESVASSIAEAKELINEILEDTKPFEDRVRGGGEMK